MLTQVSAGPYTIKGISVGGVYTSLCVPELHLGLDIGIAAKSLASIDRLFLSHGHVDHIGALSTLLGIRALMSKPKPLTVYGPAEIETPIVDLLSAVSSMQRNQLEITMVGLRPGDVLPLHSDLHVHAFKTHHPVPSLGYQFVRRVQKLKPEFHGLAGPEIAAKRRAGEDILYSEEHLELAYATDTLARVLTTSPQILRSRVLILECTFLDERKSIEHTHAGCHIHLDELLEHADDFRNDHVVLMHFSQIYRPDEVHKILAQRCPPNLRQRLIAFAPKSGEWPG